METSARCRASSGWQGNSWTSCSTSIRMDGWSYLVPVGYNSQSVISYGLFSCFGDETCLRGVECNIPREVIWVVIWEVPNENGVRYY
jgi:hypothetical protein